MSDEDDKLTILSKNEHYRYSVRYDVVDFGNKTTVQIEEYSSATPGPFASEAFTWIVDLPPQQALSLLAWLRQEEDTLKQLAKEQEDSAKP